MSNLSGAARPTRDWYVLPISCLDVILKTEQTQSQEDAFNLILQQVNKLRNRSFNEQQMELLLPTLLSHVNSLTTNVEDLECSMTSTLTSLDTANAQLKEQTQAIADLRAHLTTTSLAGIFRESTLPSVHEELDALRSFFNGVVDRIAFVDAMERQDSQTREMRTIGTSTSNITADEERILVSSATQTDETGDLVTLRSVDVAIMTDDSLTIEHSATDHASPADEVASILPTGPSVPIADASNGDVDGMVLDTVA